MRHCFSKTELESVKNIQGVTFKDCKHNKDFVEIKTWPKHLSAADVKSLLTRFFSLNMYLVGDDLVMPLNCSN